MMRLRYSKPSPYARKVRVVAHELGLVRRIELVDTDTWDLSRELLAENPLGKIPSLVLADGTVLYDSPVICEYLAGLATEPVLLPAQGRERLGVVRLQALGDGIMDSAVDRYCELNFRAADKQLPSWVDRLKSVAGRAADHLETVADTELLALNVGTIAIAVALGYLDHRFPRDEWRRGRPKLAAWFATMSARESFAVTAP